MRIRKTQSVPRQQFKSRGKPGAAKPGRRTRPAGEQSFGRLLLTACFATGAAGLIYGILWVKALSLIFGSTVYAVTTVLAVFLGGLGAGSWALGRRFDRQARPILAYAWLEAGIAATALLTFLALPLLRHIYAAAGGGALLRFAGAMLLLLVPAFLIGGHFPLLVRVFREHEADTGVPVSRLYALNTGGAVVGAVAAGFVLMPALGIIRTALVAAGCNVIAALCARASAERAAQGAVLWATSDVRAAAPQPTAESRKPKAESPQPTAHSLQPTAGAWAPALSFVSGATAMILGVAWMRLMVTPLGGSTYALTIMLAAFLIGIAGGARLFTRLAPRLPVGRQGLAWLQLATMGTGVAVLAAWRLLPYLVFWLLRLSGESFAWLVVVQFLAAFLILLPPALLYGIGFPWLAALYAPAEEGVGGRVGRLYAINTAGALAGSILASLLLLPRVGSYGALAVALGAAGAAGMLLLSGWRRPLALAGIVVVLLSAAATGLFRHSAVDQQGLLTVYRRVQARSPLSLGEIAALRDLVFLEDGLNSTVAVARTEQNTALYVNGKADAGSGPGDMRTEIALAAVPLASHPAPRRVLVIGFGAGVTTHLAAIWPGVERVDTVEIEPAVLRAAPYFKDINGEVYRHPRSKLIVDDARHFLFTTREQYDVIISQPSNPWVAGVGNLFTSEFYKEAAARLNKGGVLIQWVQGYQFLPEDLALVGRTMKGAFSRISLWYGESADFFLVGSQEPAWPVTAQWHVQFQGPSQVTDLLRRYLAVDLGYGIWAYCALGYKDFTQFSGTGEVNTDDQPLLEYGAPWRLVIPQSDTLWKAISEARTETVAPLMPAEGKLAVARTLLRLGRPQEAIDLAKSVDEQLRDSPRLALFLGDVQRQFGDPETAVQGYRQAIERGEGARGLAGLALSVHKKGDVGAAEPLLREAIAAASSAPDVDLGELQSALATVLSQTARFDEAISWQQKAVHNDQPKRYLRAAELAQLYWRKGDTAAAQAAFQQSLALEPYGYDAHYGLAHLFLTSGRIEEAVREFRFLLCYHPLRHVSLWDSAADALRLAGHQREADRVLARRRALFAK
jgi:spermidine synthase